MLQSHGHPSVTLNDKITVIITKSYGHRRT